MRFADGAGELECAREENGKGIREGGDGNYIQNIIARNLFLKL